MDDMNGQPVPPVQPTSPEYDSNGWMSSNNFMPDINPFFNAGVQAADPEPGENGIVEWPVFGEGALESTHFNMGGMLLSLVSIPSLH